jgi:TolB protein
LASFGGPSWLRDGRHLAFSISGGSLANGVYTIAVDGSDMKLIVPGASWPEVSPDGSRLAYLRWDAHQHRALYVSNPDGTGELRLTRAGEDVQQGFSWSPDGKTIAFTRVRDNRFEIRSVGTTGGGERTLLASKHADFGYPSWRPAGARLPAAHRSVC